MEAEKEKEALSIVVKLPFDLQERLLAFPFLHLLHDRYPEAEYHFITPRKDIEVLNLLPFRAFYHEFEEDEIGTVFDVHRYVVNSKIYRTDIFFSLTNSFTDACLGLFLKARQRVGFSDNWKTLVLNQKTPRLFGHHVCEDYFSLLKAHLGGEIETKIKAMSRDLPAVIEDWQTLPYVAVNLAPIRNAAISEQWVDFISRFENQRFVFFASESQEEIQLLLESFLAKLPKNNFYVPFLLKSWIDLAKMLAYAKGVVTFNGPAATVSAYAGSKTLVLYDREDPKRHGPLYFLADVLFLTAEESKSQGPMAPSATFHMGQVADRAHEFFRL